MKPALAALLCVIPSAHAACSTNAVFLALGGQIRGYPLRANGPTAPCQLIQGPTTTLATARALAFGKHDSIHVAQFLTNSTFNIFPAHASGDTAPAHSVMLLENDLVALAVDSNQNDFVLSIRQPNAPIFVVPPATDGLGTSAAVIADPNLVRYVSLAIDQHDNIVVAGYDAQGIAHIDTLATSANLTAPSVLRGITGDATGLLPGAGTFGSNNLNIALDPETNEIYIYNSSADQTNIQVSVFGPDADGNASPIRVIAGPDTQITGPGFAGASKIGVSSDGRLFVAEPNNRILVFAPGSNGNVAPSQIIKDSTTDTAAQGGIGVRSCLCGKRH